MSATVPAANERPPRSRTLKAWLIIGTVIAALSVLPAAFMGMMSVMASDAGVNGRIYAFIYLMLTFPLAIVIGPAAAWIAFAFRKERASWILLFAPLLWVLAIIVLMTVGLGDPQPH